MDISRFHHSRRPHSICKQGTHLVAQRVRCLPRRRRWRAQWVSVGICAPEGSVHREPANFFGLVLEMEWNGFVLGYIETDFSKQNLSVATFLLLRRRKPIRNHGKSATGLIFRTAWGRRLADRIEANKRFSLFQRDRPVLQPRCRRSVGAPKLRE